MDNEIITRINEACYRVSSRIQSKEVDNMNINDYIACLTDMATLSNSVDPNSGKGLERDIGIFAYLRDKNGAKTYKEAHDVLRKSKVDSKIVKLWMEENMLRDEVCSAVCEGYPQYAKRARKLLNDSLKNEGLI